MNLRAVGFDCCGVALCGIIETPEDDVAAVGVLVVTGGPQYRVGSHRQFVQLSRYLSQSGFASMRFDHRGSGDSDGELQQFDELDDDIEAAIGCFIDQVPGVERVVIWGLCDAASAALIYAHRDPRVAGLVLLNPWVRQQQTQAQTHLKSWYRARLADREFWQRLLTGKVRVLSSLRAFVRNLVVARKPRAVDRIGFVERMLAAASSFDGPVLVVLSGEDLTAREFAHVAASGQWRDWYQSAQVTRIEMPGVNHTFSRRSWKNAVAEKTEQWLRANACDTRPAGSFPDTPSR